MSSGGNGPDSSLSGVLEPMKKNPWPYIVVLIAAVVIVLIFMFIARQNEFIEGPLQTAQPDANTPAEAETVIDSGNATATQPTTAPATSNLTYAQAVKQYEGRRIQFNEQCGAQPSTMTLKRGTAVMFDNRWSGGRWITIDGKRYYLKGFGFTIITLTSQTLPHTVHIDCQTLKNVAQILLQR